MTWSLWLLQERKWSSRRPWPKATRRESEALQVPGIWALVVILIFVTYFARWGNLPYFDPEEHEIESGLLAMIPKQGSQSKNHLWFQPKRVPPSTNSLYSPLQSCGCWHIFLLFKHFPGPWGRDKFGKFGKQPSSSFSCAWIFMVQKNYYGFLIPKGFLFCHWVVEKISDFELTGAWPANKKPPGGKSLLFPPIENLQVGDCKDWLNIWGRSCMQCCCAGFWCNSWIIQRGMSAGLMSHILICSFKQDASAFPYEREHEREQEREHQQEH